MFKKLKGFKYGLGNIFKWWKVIYNDRDYDQHYIYQLLYFKLKNMEDFYRSDKAWSATAIKTADEIKVAKNLCKRLAEENYLHNALAEHEKLYPKYYDNFWQFEKIEGKPYYKLVSKNTKEEEKSFRRCGKLADYLEEQDKEMLFTYLKKHIDKWWD